MSAGAYNGPERRSSAGELGSVLAGIERLSSQMEGETRFRDWVRERVDEIKASIFGNGKKGLVREMDAVQMEVKHLTNDFQEFKNEVQGLIRRVASWAITACVSAIALIIFELVMLALRKGQP